MAFRIAEISRAVPKIKVRPNSSVLYLMIKRVFCNPIGICNVVLATCGFWIMLFLAGFTLGAPHQSMTENDWRVYAWQHFTQTLPLIVVAFGCSFLLNMFLCGLSQIQKNGAAKISLVQSLLLSVALMLTMTTGAAFGAYSIYVEKPSYFG